MYKLLPFPISTRCGWSRTTQPRSAESFALAVLLFQPSLATRDLVLSSSPSAEGCGLESRIKHQDAERIRRRPAAMLVQDHIRLEQTVCGELIRCDLI